MTRGLITSLLLHMFVFLLVVFGLPSLFQRERLEEPQAISVELLTVADITNVKNRTQPPPKKKPEPEKPKAKPEPAPAKPVKKPQPPVKKEKEIPVPKPEPVLKPTPPKEEKPKEKPKDKKPEKKSEEDSLDAILKSVKETAQKQQETAPAQDSPDAPSRSDTAYIDSLPLTMSEKDAIRNQIAKCWSPPIGAKDAHNLAAQLRVTYEQDGSLINVFLSKTQQARYHSDSFFRSAVDSAMRAVRACQPLQGMPPDKYQRWRDVELTFDPRDLLY